MCSLPSVKFVLLLITTFVVLFGSAALSAQSPEPKRIVFASEQVDTPPEPKRRIRIRWPSGTKKGDSITLRFIVTSEGHKEEFTVMKFTNADMVGPAAEAYEKATYTPAIKDGRNVAAWVTVIETVR